MSTVRCVNILKVALFKVTSVPFIKVANDIMSVGRQLPLCASGGCFNNLMTLRYKLFFNLSVPALMHRTDLAFWMIAG